MARKTFCDRCDDEGPCQRVQLVRNADEAYPNSLWLGDLCPRCLEHVRQELTPLPKPVGAAEA